MPSELTPLLQAFLAIAPRIGATLFVLLLGLLVTLVVRGVVIGLVRRSGLEALAERHGVGRLLYAIGVKRSLSDALGWVAGLLGLLSTTAIAAETAGLPGFAEGVGAVMAFVPNLVAAGVLVLFGMVAADALYRLIHTAGKQRADVVAPRFIATAAYYSVLAVTLPMAAEHLGLEIALFSALVQVVAAAALFALGLTFALGARPYFGEIMARYYAQRIFPAGCRVRVDGVEGDILVFGAVTATLRTDEGEVVVPCSALLRGPVHIVRPAA